MPEDKPRQLTKVYWKDVRKRIAALNPELAKLIDAIDPGKDYPLYTAKYRFGDLIVDEGLFHLPDENGRLLALNDSRHPSSVREDLGYGDGRIIPMGMILQNSAELFIKPQNRIQTWQLFETGSIFALWYYMMAPQENFHPPRIFSLTAGARCIFMLPNIGDEHYHKNFFRQLGVRVPLAKTLADQHEVFKTIAQHPALECDWHLEVLLFTKRWIEKINNIDKKWIYLRDFFLNYVWAKSVLWRNLHFFNLSFSCSLTGIHKPDPYLCDTAKHLWIVASGSLPGLAPALDNVVAPIKLLQKVFLEIYHIKQIPTILVPTNFSLEKQINRPVYYSLTYPTTMEFCPKSRKEPITLIDLKELRMIMENFLNEINSGKLKIEESKFGEIAAKIRLDFFHNKPDYLPGIYRQVRLTTEMPSEDDAFKKCLIPIPSNKTFAHSGPFIRGCIKISLK